MRMTSLLAAALAVSASSPALANTVLDAPGDFAFGYTGGAADLDVRSFTVNYNGTTKLFSFAATFNGAIDPATVGTYVIGVNTGTGPSAPFSTLGAPNVRFNTTFRVNKDGTTTLGSSYLATIAGSSFTLGNVPDSLFTSTGFAPEQYGFNLWPRNGVGTGTFVTDFAPNDGTISAAVPEPASWGLMILGFALVGGALRRRGTERGLRACPAG